MNGTVLSMHRDRFLQVLGFLVLAVALGACSSGGGGDSVDAGADGGTGGEEAALFVADPFRMYCRYAEGKRWRVDVIERDEPVEDLRPQPSHDALADDAQRPGLDEPGHGQHQRDTHECKQQAIEPSCVSSGDDLVE